jgi:hypothetical protein
VGVRACKAVAKHPVALPFQTEKGGPCGRLFHVLLPVTKATFQLAENPEIT